MVSFTCVNCGQVRDEGIDGGIVVRYTEPDGGVIVLEGICHEGDCAALAETYQYAMLTVAIDVMETGEEAGAVDSTRTAA